MKTMQFELNVLFKDGFAKSFLLIFLLSFLLLSCSDEKSSEEAQSIYLTPDVICGTVQFSDGCSPQLDSLISFGLALIHHMTYDDAEYTFSKVIEMDKDCFWGHWGKAMTYIHPLWPDVPTEDRMEMGWVLSQTALGLAKTEKEKLYGTALASYYKNWRNSTEQERLLAFKRGWLQAEEQLAGDLEAQLFHVLTMLATVSPDDKSYDVQREAGAIAEKALETIPDHPGGFHYAIHAYDFPPLASDALFTRLGKWDDSIELNMRSAAAAWRLPINGQISTHYFHALDYLVYAYLQQSDYDKVKNIAATIDTLSNPFQAHPATSYALAAIKGRLALEYQQWTDAANLSLEYQSKVPWKKYPQYEALVYFANGIGAGRSGDLEKAKLAFDKLGELQEKLGEPKSSVYWIKKIEVQKTVVEAWQMFAEGNREKALEIMTLAAELEDATEKNPVTPGELLPVREMLGDMLLEMDRPDEAVLQYEMALENSPNRFNSLYGVGRASELIGDKNKATTYYKTLLEICGSSDLSRERLVHASNVVNGI
jgi:tetratricopeptide (TPR) repeat protein